MLFLKQPQILPFLCHKSATICQINSSEVSNSKFKLDLCNCVKTEMIEHTSPPQWPHKRGKIFFGYPVVDILYDLFRASTWTCFLNQTKEILHHQSNQLQITETRLLHLLVETRLTKLTVANRFPCQGDEACEGALVLKVL